MNKLRVALPIVYLGLLVLAMLVWWYGIRAGPDDAVGAAPALSQDTLLARGAYLARAGNCQFCHSRRGAAAYAGGRPIETPFGTVFSSNLTPDKDSGLGAWTPADFWRALHLGRSRDGHLLTPAFPYTSYTRVTRDDATALFAFLQSLPAVATANRAHELRWPFNTQLALAVWRALYFQPEVFVADAGHDAAWNRGAYLVRGLGHCNACHSTRNLLGGPDQGPDLAGGPIPMQNWYAPSLLSSAEAGVAGWDTPQVVRLLQTGVAPRGAVTGPMAEVVQNSTQYLSAQDLGAMAAYLKSLPDRAARADARVQGANPGSSVGEKLYTKHCAPCHGEQGEGVANAYPALAGNRAVSMPITTNLVQIILRGGFAPATEGNPRPFGMPPYQMLLGDAEVAALLTYIRASWGNRAGAVTEFDVARYREQR